MDLFKKFSIGMCAFLLAGAITLTACNDKNGEDDDIVDDEQTQPTMSELGIQAANDLCACWEEYKGDFEAQTENCLYGLMAVYGADMQNEDFRDAFTIEVYQCSAEANEIFCIFGFADCEGTDAGEGMVLAADFCDCWDDDKKIMQKMQVCGPILQTKMVNLMTNSNFYAGFVLGLYDAEIGNPEVDWQKAFVSLGFFDPPGLMTDFDALWDIGIQSAIEFCECWHENEGDSQAQIEICGVDLFVNYGRFTYIDLLNPHAEKPENERPPGVPASTNVMPFWTAYDVTYKDCLGETVLTNDPHWYSIYCAIGMTQMLPPTWECP